MTRGSTDTLLPRRSHEKPSLLLFGNGSAGPRLSESQPAAHAVVGKCANHECGMMPERINVKVWNTIGYRFMDDAEQRFPFCPCGQILPGGPMTTLRFSAMTHASQEASKGADSGSDIFLAPFPSASKNEMD